MILKVVSHLNDPMIHSKISNICARSALYMFICPVDLSLYCVLFFGPAIEPEVVQVQLGYRSAKNRGRMVGQKI